MADFCKPCSIKMFGRDFGDIKAETEDGAAIGLCEGCGLTLLCDHNGDVLEVIRG